MQMYFPIRNQSKIIWDRLGLNQDKVTKPKPETGLNLPFCLYSGLNLNQDKATKPQTVQIVRQGEATPYWFKFNPL